MPQAMLEVSGLQVNYGRIPAVRQLTMSVAAGECVCLVGPNGAGKSTTTLAIAGALKPSAGRVTLDGRNITGMAAENIATLGVTLVPEGRHVFTRMSVMENLWLSTRLSRRASVAACRKVFELFPILEARRDSAAGSLSGGEQQQLVLARAILTNARLIIVDEPSLGLAPLVVESVFSVLRKLRDAGTTLLVVEQSLNRTLSLADRLYIMRSGIIRFHGPVGGAQARQQIEQAYFGHDLYGEACTQ